MTTRQQAEQAHIDHVATMNNFKWAIVNGAGEQCDAFTTLGQAQDELKEYRHDEKQSGVIGSEFVIVPLCPAH